MGDRTTKNNDIQWLPTSLEGWDLIKAKYCFLVRKTKGNSVRLELLSPTQKYGVIPQSKYEELSSMVTVKVSEQTDLNNFRTVHKGDFCISLRSFEGGFEYSEYEGVVSPAYTIFYPSITINDVYYKHLFKLKTFIYEMNSHSLSLRDGKPISFTDFGNTYILVPPISEQRAIAKFLDGKCSEIDAIITGKQQQLENLKTYKQSIIYEYVTGKKEVPENE